MVDEIDFIEMVLATLPMLRVLAGKIEQYRDPREDRRDEIVRLGMRLSGFDVDNPRPRPRRGDPVYPGDAVHPRDSSMMSDVAMGIEAVVEAVRWRLQRLSLVLMSAVESQQVNKSTSQQVNSKAPSPRPSPPGRWRGSPCPPASSSARRRWSNAGAKLPGAATTNGT